jgi:hypothetical protein
MATLQLLLLLEPLMLLVILVANMSGKATIHISLLAFPFHFSLKRLEVEVFW